MEKNKDKNNEFYWVELARNYCIAILESRDLTDNGAGILKGIKERHTDSLLLALHIFTSAFIKAYNTLSGDDLLEILSYKGEDEEE